MQRYKKIKKYNSKLFPKVENLNKLNNNYLEKLREEQFIKNSLSLLVENLKEVQIKQYEETINIQRNTIKTNNKIIEILEEKIYPERFYFVFIYIIKLCAIFLVGRWFK